MKVTHLKGKMQQQGTTDITKVSKKTKISTGKNTEAFEQSLHVAFVEHLLAVVIGRIMPCSFYSLGSDH